MNASDVPRRFDDDDARLDRHPAAGVAPATFVAATLATTLLLAVALVSAWIGAASTEVAARLVAVTEVVAVVKPGIADASLQALRDRLAARADVAEVRVASIDAFAHSLPGATELGLKQLPSVVRVRPADRVTGLRAWCTALRGELSASGLVDGVRSDDAWVERADGWLARLDSARAWLPLGAAAFVVLGTVATWFLATNASLVAGRRAGAHIVLIAVFIAVAICAAAGFGFAEAERALLSERIWAAVRLPSAMLVATLVGAGLLGHGLARAIARLDDGSEPERQELLKRPPV